MLYFIGWFVGLSYGWHYDADFQREILHPPPFWDTKEKDVFESIVYDSPNASERCLHFTVWTILLV